MKRMAISITVLLLLGMVLSTQVSAEEAASAKSYSGDFLTRSALTGDWGGTRNEWAKKGVTFDTSLTQTGMSVISGGKNQGWEYAGRGNLTINMDSQKMGLWPGGFLTIEIEGNYNRTINLDTGAITPVNTNQLFPMIGHQEVNIPAVTFMQFFSHNFGVVLGKFDTLSGDANEFAHGKGDKQFSNMAFNLNMVALLTPTSALGAGVVILPTKDPNAAIITATVIDANGKANRSGFDTAFEGNLIYGAEGRIRTDFFGMTGHQLVGVAYNTRDFSSLDQSLRSNILHGAINKKDSSWCFYYNFDQYLYEPKKGQGIGLFGRFGASDGNPNPVHHFYSLGIGGKGVVPGRPLDQFGIGYYYMDISNPTLTGPLATRELLRDEYGVEAYYNVAITPWMKLTPDIQFIRGAQKDQATIVAGIPPHIIRSGIDTATVVGLRLQLIF